jgi:putative DNA primase/helicase
MEMLMAPILPSQGLVMIHGPGGVGKTYLALSIALTTAYGGQMFDGKWKAEKQRRVLYVDGEMPAYILQKRLKELIKGNDITLRHDDLKIVTPDLLPYPISDLSTLQGKQWIEYNLDNIDLLILDNLSCLFRAGRENDSDGWSSTQEWLLKLRRQGLSVLFLHHTGKDGEQRGTSKKEDVLDTVIGLRRSEDYCPSQGIHCQIYYEKARGFYGKELRPFTINLLNQGDSVSWQVMEQEQDQEKQDIQKIIGLHESGMSSRKIAEQVGVSKSRVLRVIKKM